jgi:phosphoserine aminotransferase
MSRVFNFNPGPAALPLPALERAREELLDYRGSGMSIMEHSHRGKDYEAVHNEAISLLREQLSISDDYHVLFLQGGASMQFAMVPMNLLTAGKSADYVLTGAWSEKALSEAKPMAALYSAAVRAAGTTGTGEGKEKSYVRAATEADVKADDAAVYLHLCSNETVHGVQFAVNGEFPHFGKAPVVADMSSDFLWRKIDVSRFGMIYAGAQKNVGPSGVTVVVVRKDLVDAGRKDLPKIFQYRTHVENNSLYNTPSTFGIYIVRNVLLWVKDQGGLAGIEKINREKAWLLYKTIDSHPGFYRCPVDAGSRSVMNVVFRLPSEALEEKFVSESKKAGLVGLKGHRSVGGIRASIYNATGLDAIHALTHFMNEFAKANG